MAFCKKPPKLVDLFKTNNFLCKLSCFRVLTKFLSKALSSPNKTAFGMRANFTTLRHLHFIKKQKGLDLLPKLHWVSLKIHSHCKKRYNLEKLCRRILDSVRISQHKTMPIHLA